MILGTRVYDNWWPHRMGAVTASSKTSVHVKWDDGEVVRYDQAHLKFLRVPKQAPKIDAALKDKP